LSDAPRHIAFVTTGYPTPRRPFNGRFVEQLVRAVMRLGTRCTVIHPISLHEMAWKVLHPGRKLPADGDCAVPVRRPAFVFCTRKSFGPLDGRRATQALFNRAVFRALRRLDPPPDVVYGHFIYGAGLSAVRAARRLGIPVFVASGESTLDELKHMGLDRARRELRHLTGMIAVSALRKRQLQETLALPPERIAVFPNGVDLTVFFPRDRRAMREKHGLPQDQFLVAFVGHFDHRKGVARVAQALEGLQGVSAVYVGAGPLAPQGEQMAFRAVLPHDAVAEILSAADVFVLPTLAEGSNNAIIEGMAAGLPIITSRGEFNDDLVDQATAIRVDPLDVLEIRDAIVALRDDEDRRRRMADAALARAQQLDIRKRAEEILAWIAGMI